MKNNLISILDFIKKYPHVRGPSNLSWFKYSSINEIISKYEKLKKYGIIEWYVLSDDNYVDSFYFEIDSDPKYYIHYLICELNKFHCDEMSVVDDENVLMLKIWWD